MKNALLIVVGLIVGAGVAALVFALMQDERRPAAEPAAARAPGGEALLEESVQSRKVLERMLRQLGSIEARLAAVPAPAPKSKTRPPTERWPEPRSTEGSAGESEREEGEGPPSRSVARFDRLETLTPKDAAVRRRWFHRGEDEALRHFGTPATAYVRQNGTVIWTYEKKDTHGLLQKYHLEFFRGRLHTWSRSN